jgi:hypothetical protein
MSRMNGCDEGAVMSQDLIPITQLGLPIPNQLSDFAWQQGQLYRSSESQWNIYLNQIAGQLLWQELQTDFADVTWWDNPPPHQSTLLWQFVQGTVLELNQKRLVLLPDRTIDRSELVIPQEWVDIPTWAGDYFLAVQIDPDEQFLHCWGYATHQQIKAKAQYLPDDRTYRLDAHDLIADIGALWVVQQLNPTEVTQAVIAPLPVVTPAAAANWLHYLGNVPTPRLAMPFEPWGALLVDPAWLQRLAAMRPTVAAVKSAITPAQTMPFATQLNDWLQNILTPGWQAIEDWLGNDTELGLALRQSPPLAAAPMSMVRRCKVLRLPEQVLLLLTVEIDPDGLMGIQVQLRVADRDQTIPANLSLELVGRDGKIVQAVQARQQDNAIQLPRFRSPTGTPFSIQVQLNRRSPELTFSESFVA